MVNERELAFEILSKIFYDGGYSNLTINSEFEKHEMSKQQKAFASRLIYGVLERAITLDYMIGRYIKKPLNKLDKEIIVILRVGFYQLKYMDNVPDNASVNETVNLCIVAKKTSAKSFVNAIMRSFIRDDKQLINKNKGAKALSVEYSAPEWLCKMWVEQYGEATAKNLLVDTLEAPPIYIRVNTLKSNIKEVMDYLTSKGAKPMKVEEVDNCICIQSAGNVKLSDSRFYVQDLSSQICCSKVDAKPNQKIADLCSAPGAKSFTVAQYMENKGVIKSYDIHQHKVELVQKTAKNLGVDIIETEVFDARKLNEDLGLCDCVVCDVPCSGLGVLRRKPEIKYNQKQDNNLPKIQLAIALNGANYVKVGGRLIYSTCTINKNENQNITEQFLKQNENFKLIEQKQLMSHIDRSDGFYYAVLERET